MAIEFSRETSVRKICPDPASSSDHVKLKVLDKISFIDAKAQYQEFQFSFNNGPNADRVTHSEKVGEELDVERIDNLSVIDPKDFYQESLFSFLRYQQGVHLKTHRTKIYALKSDGTKDEGVWIEVERIDQISFVDPKAQYQEYIYELKWPDLIDPEWDYQDLTQVVTDYDKTSINPPWRLDPFQNIVDSSFGKWDFLIATLFWGGQDLIGTDGVDWFATTRYTTEQPVGPDMGSLLDNISDFATWYYHTNLTSATDPVDVTYNDGDSVLYDLAKVRAALPSGETDIILSFRAYWIITWYVNTINGLVGYGPNTSSGDVTLQLALFKGGTVSENGNVFVWVDGSTKSIVETVTTVTVTETVADNLSPPIPGQLIARVKIPPSGKWEVL